LNAIVRAAERFGLQLRESNGLMRVNRRAARPARLPEPDLALCFRHRLRCRVVRRTTN
jgi:hypothetical protein